ncbi:hypothetical protein [Rhodanobacter sp. MP7CTX1]|uniref:hypothetical protein n=1 Tax=Rhodanobacter sp. MP7CTX1 TaxID=2723084 RepID=UPI0016086028|nr:hypothetical protein [Rhodanobacter sp. MP7CTX1]MBB6186665.1 hypothetical protein [Rhodanobacter sp. MP7CTX1]
MKDELGIWTEMTGEESRSKFPGLWRRAMALPSLNDLQADLVSGWAHQMEIKVLDVSERSVGIFRPTPAVVLQSDEGIACFPKVAATGDPQWVAHKVHLDRIASLWEKVEWFAPLWVPQGKVNELLQAIEHRSKEDALRLFEYHTSTIYTLPFQAVCIAQFLPQSRSLSVFAPIAREAYLAFYSGHRASSIAALIPVMEGAVSRISSEAAGQPVLEQVDKIIDRACMLAARSHFGDMWVPSEYREKDYLYVQDERVFVFQTFRRWLENSFFRRTGEYDGLTWLNRHLFAHGASMDWQKPSNFSRLVVAIATLGVIESWHDESNQVPLIFPGMDEDGRLLWQQAMLQAQAQMAVKQIEQQNYRQHGRLVPAMPTDDGVLLRKAVLQQECIDDLVRPLRNAGWSVEIGEPDDRSLYVKVAASSGPQKLRIALLYSCATDNELYRELAQEVDAILYRGSPYHQHQFAYGISVHVGPVTGWQPPIPQR